MRSLPTLDSLPLHHLHGPGITPLRLSPADWRWITHLCMSLLSLKENNTSYIYPLNSEYASRTEDLEWRKMRTERLTRNNVVPGNREWWRDWIALDANPALLVPPLSHYKNFDCRNGLFQGLHYCAHRIIGSWVFSYVRNKDENVRMSAVHFNMVIP